MELQTREMKINKFVKYVKSYGFDCYKRGKGDHLIYRNDELNINFAIPSGKKVKTGLVWNFNRLIKQCNINTYKRVM